MAWIASHQALRDHPKVADLASAMGWDLDTTLGKLHRLWWWCVDYAEDGDLRRHNANRIAAAMGVAPNDPAKQLLQALIDASWIDTMPYLRIHDWWDHIGLFLQRKYGNRQPRKWQSVQRAYKQYNNRTARVRIGCTPADSTNITNQHNQPTNQKQKTADSPAALNAYLPRVTALLKGKRVLQAPQIAKASYAEAVKLLRPHPERLEALLEEIAGLPVGMGEDGWYLQAIRGKVAQQLNEVSKQDGSTINAVLRAAAG